MAQLDSAMGKWKKALFRYMRENNDEAWAPYVQLAVEFVNRKPWTLLCSLCRPWILIVNSTKTQHNTLDLRDSRDGRTLTGTGPGQSAQSRPPT